MTTFKGRAIHDHCILYICIFSFHHFGFVVKMLALIVLMCVQEFSEQRFFAFISLVRTDRTMTIRI